MSQVIDETIEPTPERHKHGEVQLLDRIADEEGRISRPHRAIDILAALERSKAITDEMRQAGEDFRAQFNAAHLNTLKALDLSKPFVSGNNGSFIGHRIVQARESVWRAVRAVGGIKDQPGSCLWQVIGLEQTLKDWAKEQTLSGRRVNPEMATGILVSALGMLKRYYENNA